MEDQLSQARAIDLAAAHIFGTEFTHHGVEARGLWGVDGMAGLISVDHRGSELAKHLGRGGLARPRAACQPNELQFA